MTQSPPSRPHPGELLLVNAADGGYDPETGFAPGAREPVAGSPELLTPQEAAARAAAELAALAGRARRPRGRLPGRWRRRAGGSPWTSTVSRCATRPPRCWPRSPRVSRPRRPGPRSSRGTCTTSARPTRSGRTRCARWRATASWRRSPPGRPWAKSGTTAKPGRLEFAGGQGFRHELASLLLLDGPLRGLLAASPDPDLTRYLVLAHHGRLRVRVNDPDGFEQGAVTAISRPYSASRRPRSPWTSPSFCRLPADGLAHVPARGTRSGPGPRFPLSAVRPGYPGLPGDSCPHGGLAGQRRPGTRQAGKLKAGKLTQAE